MGRVEGVLMQCPKVYSRSHGPRSKIYSLTGANPTKFLKRLLEAAFN